MKTGKLTAVPPPPPCSYAGHDELRANRAHFVAGTDSIGLMEDGDGGWIYCAQCRRCGSMLAIPVTAEVAATWRDPPRPLVDALTRETAEAAAKLGVTPDEMSVALAICPRCAGDLVGGVCALCERQRRGERCCQYAARFTCFCEAAWTCAYHGETHRGSHD